MKSKLEKLKDCLREKSAGGIALAFSGGVDSSLLLAALCLIRREKPYSLQALTIHTVLHQTEEKETAEKMTKEMNVPHHFFFLDPLSFPEIRENPADRCYRCKKILFSEIKAHASKNQLTVVMDGTNADDLKVYRPGRRALKELGILSPLAETGLSKVDIREMAAELGLECASRPAAPCLATRFEYGTLLTPDAVRKVADGENFLRGLVPGSEAIRLRMHGAVARIEVPVKLFPEIISRRQEVTDGLRRLNFQYITLDLEGFRSGSMDLNL